MSYISTGLSAFFIEKKAFCMFFPLLFYKKTKIIPQLNHRYEMISYALGKQTTDENYD
jgi:hypothetical protein